MLAVEQQVSAGALQTDANGDISTANFASSCTAGNAVVVITRCNTNKVGAITDTLGTSYSEVTYYDSGNPPMAIWVGTLASSGTNAITASFGDSVRFGVWVHATEISGATIWTVADSVSTRDNGGTTDIEADAIDVSADAALIIAGASNDNTYATYTAGSDFTLLNGSIGHDTSYYGGVQYRITSAPLSSYVTHITSTASGVGATIVVAAFSDLAITRTPGAGGIVLLGFAAARVYTRLYADGPVAIGEDPCGKTRLHVWCEWAMEP